MSIVFTTTIDIAATPDEVWEVLSDFPAYGEWSNFSRVDGTPESAPD
nr:SRPBCC family protein [Herbiconiux ginsengi]